MSQTALPVRPCGGPPSSSKRSETGKLRKGRPPPSPNEEACTPHSHRAKKETLTIRLHDFAAPIPWTPRVRCTQNYPIQMTPIHFTCSRERGGRSKSRSRSRIIKDLTILWRRPRRKSRVSGSGVGIRIQKYRGRRRSFNRTRYPERLLPRQFGRRCIVGRC